MYGKIINNKLEYAPNIFVNDEGGMIVNFCNDIQSMKYYGYKEIIDIVPEFNPETQTINLAEITYTEDENTITINYPIVDKFVETFPTQNAKIKALENEQIDQDNQILQNMLATAEICEMVLGVTTQAVTFSELEANNNSKAGDSVMVELYAQLVLLGYYTTDPSKVTDTVKLVPEFYRQKVIAKLNEWE